jgi:hypothetical protein
MSEQLQEADPLDDALGIQPRLRDRMAARLTDPLRGRTTTESELGGFDVAADAIIYLN